MTSIKVVTWLGTSGTGKPHSPFHAFWSPETLIQDIGTVRMTSPTMWLAWVSQSMAMETSPAFRSKRWGRFLVETLGLRHKVLHKEQSAGSKEGQKLFGTMDFESTLSWLPILTRPQCSHDKTM
jgi:hypothetical protein